MNYLQTLAEAKDAQGEPLVPGLRRPCPDCKGKGQLREIVYGTPPINPTLYPCKCGGSGQVPVSEAKALLAMLDYCHAQNWAVHMFPRTVWIGSGEHNIGSALAPGIAGLAEAVCKARGLVKP